MGKSIPFIILGLPVALTAYLLWMLMGIVWSWDFLGFLLRITGNAHLDGPGPINFFRGLLSFFMWAGVPIIPVLMAVLILQTKVDSL